MNKEQLSIEEKARAYDEAYKKVAIRFGSNVADEIFLKESEDERIRKEMIEFFTFEHWDGEAPFSYESAKERVAWLEKQGEQKSVITEDKDAERAAEEYKNFRMCCGIKDPVMLNEIEEAYYEGAIRQQKSVELDEEDECNMINICAHLRSVLTDEAVEKYRNWLKSLKDRVQPQQKQEWKQENTGELTDFENAMMHIGGSFFGQHAGLDPNDTSVVKEQAKLLLELVPNKEWSEEDEDKMQIIINIIKDSDPDWEELINWLKSLRPQNRWKPSDEQIKVCKEVYADLLSAKGFDLGTVNSELNRMEEELKKLREE